MIPVFSHKNNIVFVFSLFSVINHQYARDSNFTKKVDNKALLFDYEFFEKLTHPEFIEQFEKELIHFVELLNQKTEPKDNYSLHTQRQEVRSKAFATVSTSEPSIVISLAFEVKRYKKSLF